MSNIGCSAYANGDSIRLEIALHAAHMKTVLMNVLKAIQNVIRTYFTGKKVALALLPHCQLNKYTFFLRTG